MTVQAITEPAAVAAASSVTVLPAMVAVPPAPMPMQDTEEIARAGPGASVIVVEAPETLNVWVAPLTPVPDVTVVMVWLVQPLLPVKVKPTTAPMLIFVSVRVGKLVLVKTHVILADVFIAEPGILSVLPDSEPNEPGLPVMELLASVQLAAVTA